MPESLTIDPLTSHGDHRGLVFEPLPPEELLQQQNVHVVITLPGCVRGNHYHLQGRETVALMGPSLVRLRQDGNLRDLIVPEGAVYKLSIPPGVSHAFKNTGTTPNILVCFNTCPHDPHHPDVVKDVLISP
jgi:dTDP-4-dehydrorhamnose 3,5-epimerase-like enzyme